MKKYFIATLFLSLLLLSCNNITQPHENSCSSDSNVGIVRFSFSSEEARANYVPDNIGANLEKISKIVITATKKSDSEAGFTSEAEPVSKEWVSTEDISAADAFKDSGYIELATGIYDFTVEIWTENVFSHLSQKGKLFDVEINAGENTVYFKTEFSDSGNVLLDFQWDSYIPSKIKIGIFDFETDEPLVVDGVSFDYEDLEVTAKDNVYSASYYKENVPNGMYRLKYYIYEAYNEDVHLKEPNPDVLYVKGFQTTNLNTTIEITSAAFKLASYSYNLTDLTDTTAIETEFRSLKYPSIVVFTGETTEKIFDSICTIIDNASVAIDVDMSGVSGIQSFNHTFYSYNNIRSLTMPSSITSIDGIGELKKLEVLAFPATVTSILEDENTYTIVSDKCPSLKKFIITGEKSERQDVVYSTVKDGAILLKTDADETVTLVSAAPAYDFGTIDFSDSDLKGVDLIGYAAFYGCKNLTGIESLGNVKVIFTSAFEDTGLGGTNLEIPASVYAIAARAFYTTPSINVSFYEGAQDSGTWYWYTTLSEWLQAVQTGTPSDSANKIDFSEQFTLEMLLRYLQAVDINYYVYIDKK